MLQLVSHSPSSCHASFECWTRPPLWLLCSRCCLAYLVQAPDRHAKRQNWMDAAFPASSVNSNSSLQISTQPSVIWHTKCAVLCFQALAPSRISVLVQPVEVFISFRICSAGVQKVTTAEIGFAVIFARRPSIIYRPGRRRSLNLTFSEVGLSTPVSFISKTFAATFLHSDAPSIKGLCL